MLDFLNPWELVKNGIGFFWDKARVILPLLIGRVLLTLGIGGMVYTMLLPELVDFVQQYLNTMSQPMIDMFNALRIDQALTLLFSASAAKVGTRVAPIRLGGTDAVTPP